ncbi:MAG: 16S rRNA (uracil(1498)-N(3))-methyltransferase [Lachnospiraceae bacterium]|nr:16S rRNA (uracil(1498)-N(3))-methyltransferase [Lachnospiraceae bacterium]
MHWFYVESSQITEDEIRITGKDVNHIKNVLRMTKGERMVICDGEGRDYYCTLKDIGSKEVVAHIESMNATESELPAKLYLFQGLPKKDKMELIIQKAVELGAYEIIPVAMKRCVAKIEDKKKEARKLERWQSIAESAAKQSGRGFIPKVQGVLSYKEALKYAGELETVILPYELAKDMNKTKEVLAKCCTHHSIGIFIGPEGGFDDAEIEEALQLGFETVSLGKRILRTETAGLAILSVLMMELEYGRAEE